MKKYSLILLVLCWCLFGTFTTVEAHLDRVVDEADVLTDSEEAELKVLFDEISERQQFDVAVVVVDWLDGYTAEAYADDYYDYNGYGFGSSYDGTLLLVGMDEREWHITTCGYGLTALTDAGLEYISDSFLSDLSDGDYADAFETYAKLCDEFVTQAKQGKPYDRDNLPKEPFPIVGNLLLSLGIGAVVSLIVVLCMRSGMKNVRFQHSAVQYEKSGSMILEEQKDMYLFSNVSKRARPKNNSSGSSSHRSSSGRSHGGRGGRF